MKSSLTFEPDISQRISVLCVLFFNKTTKKSSGLLDSSRTQTMPMAISFQKHKFVYFEAYRQGIANSEASLYSLQLTISKI